MTDSKYRRIVKLLPIILTLLLCVGVTVYGAWTAPRTWTTNELVTAAMMNTDIRDNMTELRAGGLAISSQAANEIIYASSASQLTRSTSFTFNGSLLTIPGQIKFPSAQSSSADANTLDDYEEGPWTIVIGGSGGTSGQSYNAATNATYVKTGTQVCVQGYAFLSNKGTITTSVQIQGLPFTSVISANKFQTLGVEFYSLATSWINIRAEVQPNTTAATLFGAAAATTSMSGLVAADISNTTQLVVGGCYLTAQ